MKFSTSAAAAQTVDADLLVVFVFADGSLSAAASAIDVASKGAVAAAVATGDLTGKVGSTLLLRSLPGIKAKRVLLAGLGEAALIAPKHYCDALRAVFRAALATTAKKLAIAPVLPAERDPGWAATQMVVLAVEAGFRSDQLKSEKTAPMTEIASIEWLSGTSDKSADKVAEKRADKLVKVGFASGLALANGMSLTKELGNLPSNVCTPTYLGETAKSLAKQFKFKVQVLDRKAIEALGMGSFLSVSAGAAEPPRFIVLEHKGGPAKQAPVVLVGKGITFDTGGVSIKPAAEMDEMKYDMCGAGTVLGTFRAIGEMDLPLNVVGLIPTCENMVSGTATKPGDIVTTMSGQTIEVLNTDAEGRLILADALTYAERFKPAAVIDIATLTGACVIALGHINTGLFSPDDALAAELLASGKKMIDPAWRMPVEDEYQDGLKSNFADMANIGGRPGGAITAACLLSRFTRKYSWAHLDIAGTAWKGGAAKGATGRPVPLLVNFLMSRATG
ncbi:leucyl aminopeptidase [soil metagenome]